MKPSRTMTRALAAIGFLSPTRRAIRIFIQNARRGCIDLLSAPGHILIRGTGTVDVTAEVTQLGIGSVSGTFDPLTFDGSIAF